MTAFFENLMDRGAMPGLVATWSFTQARHRVIAENVANATTPGYKAKRLDLASFQAALGEAYARRGDDPRRPLTFEGSDQAHTQVDGTLTFTPDMKPGRNAVFHDGTNVSLEQEMSDLAQNAMLHELTTQLIRGRFDQMQKAIRGQA